MSDLLSFVGLPDPAENAALARALVIPYPSHDSLLLFSSDDGRELCLTSEGPGASIRLRAGKLNPWKLDLVEVGLGARLDSALGGIMVSPRLTAGSLSEATDRADSDPILGLDPSIREDKGVLGGADGKRRTRARLSKR
jgi:hypothetical protein